MAKRRRLNPCVHDGWLQADENTWWKTVGSSLCKECNEPTIVIQNNNCYRCGNKINEVRFGIGNYGYFCNGNIYCKDCKSIFELNVNICQKVIINEYK